ncbi:MAG: hypothetical protein HY897_05125 [Deltaproteobacteria bacterium]|nr:hypothetical protein [Deltaproteobacteria bacterium]
MRTLVAAFCLVFALFPTPALADVDPPLNDDSPPEVKACKYKIEGETCTISGSGAAGTCRWSMCGVYENTKCLKCLDEEGHVPGSGCDCSSLGIPTIGEVSAFLVAGSFSLLFFFGRWKRGRRER